MAKDTHYHSKMKEREHTKEMMDKSKTQKPAGQISNFSFPCLMSICSSDLQILSVLLTTKHFFLMVSFHIKPLMFLGMYSMALVSPTSCCLQSNPAFTFTASHSDLSGPPYRDTLITLAVLSHRGRFRQPFLVFLRFKVASFYCLLGL